MKQTIVWKKLSELSGAETHEMLKARAAVFVVEQNCFYQDPDDHDSTAWHLFLRINNELAGYARVVAPGRKYPQPSIGRVMTTLPYRSRKLGRPLMREAIRFTEAEYPGQGIQIGAQAHLKEFYGSVGFQQVGEVYDEDGIPHIDMIKNPL
jgi:ElaA protein